MKKLERKIISLILTIVMIVGVCVPSITSEAASTSIKISGHTKLPSSINVGTAKTISGTITSSYNLTYINGYILASDHKTIVDKASATKTELNKYKKRYNLAGSYVDRNLDINKLSPGTYYLKITAKNTKEKAVALVDYKFTIKAAASTLKISGNTAIPTLTQGSYWTCNGTITSNYNITAVRGYILQFDSKGKETIVDSSSATPNSKSFKLQNSKVDTGLSFNILSPGTYWYKITAYDSSGKGITAVNQKFVVKKVATTGYTYNGYANGKAISSIVHNGQNPYCTCKSNCKKLVVGSGTHYCCWNYAAQVYKEIWGNTFSRTNSNNNYLRNVKASDRTLTAANLKKYLSKSKPGAVLRIDNTSSTNAGDTYGHSLVFVGMNSTGDGAWFLEGNYDGKGRTRLKNWKFSDLAKYNNYKYIKYIMWPNAGK